MELNKTNHDTLRILAGVAFAGLGLLNVIWFFQSIGWDPVYTYLLYVIGIAGCVLIAVTMFLGKDLRLVAIGSAALTVFELGWFFYGFTWNRYSVKTSSYWSDDTYTFNLLCMMPGLLYVAALALLTGFAAAFAFDKALEYREKAKELWFVPMAVYLFSRVLNAILYYAIPDWKGGAYPLYWGNFVELILLTAGLCLVCLVAAKGGKFASKVYALPDKIEGDYVDMGNETGQETYTVVQPKVYPDGYIEMVKHILLLLFTLGVWNYIWIYKTTRFLNCVKGEEVKNETTQLLLCLFVPFYVIYWIYKNAQRIDKLAAQRGVESDITTISLLFAIFIYILAPIFMQDKINNIVMPAPKPAYTEAAAAPAQKPVVATAPAVVVEVKTPAQEPAAEAAPVKDVVAELKGYKELLDSGILTQEEFDVKKQQLLGL